MKKTAGRKGNTPRLLRRWKIFGHATNEAEQSRDLSLASRGMCGCYTY